MRVVTCIFVEHNLWLVGLAAVTCLAGSTVTLQLWRRAIEATGRTWLDWCFLTAVTAGASIWATHFVAMLGHRPGVPVTFDPALTIASVLVAIAGAGAGVGLATSARPTMGLCGGGLVGLAAVAMHYMGMFAYRVEGIVQWSSGLFALSIVVAVSGVAATAHLARRWPDGPRRHAPTGALVGSIVSLHFLGMGAFAVTPVHSVSESSDTRTLVALALGVAVVALVVVGAGVSGHLIENRLRTSSENQLRHVALHDALTGLANRRYFAEALDARCAAMQAGGPGLALILVDLDRFKAVNDTYGHLVGDVVLHRAAERLAAAVADAGELARVGGDEFAILLLGEAADRAESIADRIVQLLGSPFLVEGNMAEIGASVGLARGPHDGITASELTHNADLALYAAKAAGRDGFRAFDAIMAEQVEQRRALETDLRRAVAREEFEVFYQPQVASRTGTFVGAEALIRWHHPTRGAIPPSTFIPIAEELGLVSQIGKFVLRRACEDARNWPSHLSVAVNISPVQLLDPCLSQMVAGVLHETGLDPARLEIEITETALLGNDEVALATLRALAALGIRVSLDDFGTGYSSLSYLHRFPIDSIKIDRSFVQHLPDDAGSASIVRAIAQLGQSLGLSITVEGVETAEQRDWAAKQGCDNLQGYLFSRPVPAQDLAAIWHANAGQTAA